MILKKEKEKKKKRERPAETDSAFLSPPSAGDSLIAAGNIEDSMSMESLRQALNDLG